MALHGNRGVYDSISYAEAMEKLRTHYTAQEMAQDAKKQEQSQKLTKQERKAQTAGRKAETAQKRKTHGTAQERKEYERRKESEATQREAMTEQLPCAGKIENGKMAQKPRAKKHYIVTGTDNAPLTDLAGTIILNRSRHIAQQALFTAFVKSGNETMRKLANHGYDRTQENSADYAGLVDAEFNVFDDTLGTDTAHMQERRTHKRKRVNIDGKVIMQECLPYDTLEFTDYGKEIGQAKLPISTDFDDLAQDAALAYCEHSKEILHIDDIERQDGQAYSAVNKAIYNAKKNRINIDEKLSDTLMVVKAGSYAEKDTRGQKAVENEAFTAEVIYGKTKAPRTLEKLFETKDIIERLERYVRTHAKSNMNVQALIDSLHSMSIGESVQEQADRTGQDRSNVFRTRSKLQAMLCNAEVRAMLEEARKA